MSVCPSVCLSVDLFVSHILYLSICVCLSVYLSVYMLSCLACPSVRINHITARRLTPILLYSSIVRTHILISGGIRGLCVCVCAEKYMSELLC